MLKGLNAGFGELLGHHHADLERLRPELIRNEVNFHFTDDHIRRQLQEFVGKPYQLLIILQGDIGLKPGVTPEQYGLFTHRVLNLCGEVGLVPWALEVGNEPDLGWSAIPEWWEFWKPDRRAMFADCCRMVHETARGRGYEGHIISGGISSQGGLKRPERGIRYLEGMDWSSLPQDMVVGWHSYDNWARSNLDRVRDITGGRQIAHTEGSYNGGSGLDEVDAVLVAEDMDWWQSEGVICYCFYQLNDADPPDTFGLRRVDETWKPQAYAFMDWTGE